MNAEREQPYVTEDDVSTVKALIEDWGFEYGLQADPAKVLALAGKLGMADYVKRYNK